MKRKSGPFKHGLKPVAVVKEEANGMGKQGAFNEFIKAPAYLLAYLYFVSICYHWGYWNAFNVDIFNYFGIQDLVKGAAFALPSTFFWLAIILGLPLSISFLFSDAVLEGAKKIVLNNKKIILILMFLAILILLFIIYKIIHDDSLYKNKGIPSSTADDTLFFSALVPFIILCIASLVACIILSRGIFGNLTFRQRAIKTTIYLAAIVLPANAWFGGLNTSVLIRRELLYDYIISDKVDGKLNEYIFLGKAGDYYFLHEGNKQIAIKADSIQPLILYHYNAYDTASVTTLKRERIKLRIQKGIAYKAKPDTINRKNTQNNKVAK
jgi:hypothetical protein